MNAATAPDLDDEVSLQARLRSARKPMAEGLFPEVLALLQPAHAAALRLGLPALAGEAALLMAQSAFNADDGAAAEAWCQHALDAARRAGDRAREAAAGVVLASARAQGNDAAGAIHAVVDALACADDPMTESARLTVHVGICATYGSLGMSTQAVAAARRAWQALSPADATSDRALRVMLNLVSAGVEALDDALLGGDDAAAAPLRAELLPLLPAIEQAWAGCAPGWMRFSCAHALGMVLRHAGRLDEASVWLWHAVDEPGLVAPAERHGAWLTLALLHEQQADAAAAHRAAERAAALVADDPAYALHRASPYALRAMATVQRLLGRPDQALALERRRHAQVQRNLLHALDAQVQGLTRRLDEQALVLQNVQLRELNDQLSRSVQDMSHAAHTDPLTGLLNRRAMDEAFADLRHDGHRVCVVMIDVDHFKQVNDGHSHAVGDAVLRQVALLMADALRAPDRLGRFGGEEFVALLAGADLHDARSVAERLRLRVQDFDWLHLAAGLTVTVSLGLAMTRADDGFEQALSRADAQLYRAKAAGRNRLMTEDQVDEP